MTGSLDGTVMIWDISTASSPVVSTTPRAVLHGHRDEITCTAVSTELQIVASTSKDGTCLIHKAHSGQYVRCIKNPKMASSTARPEVRRVYFFLAVFSVAAGSWPRLAQVGSANGVANAEPAPRREGGSVGGEFAFGKVLVSPQGRIVLYSSNDLMLYLFSVNGKLLHEADAMEHLHAWALTPDGGCLLTGSERMIVKLRCLDDLRAMHVFPRVDAPIHSLSLTPEERVVLVRTKTQD